MTVIETIKPALYVACRDCRKDCLAGDLQELRCLGCRVHRACETERTAIAAYVKKQARYSAVGAIANPKQLLSLQRHLIARIAQLVADPQQAQSLAATEFDSAVKQANRFRVSPEERGALRRKVLKSLLSA